MIRKTFAWLLLAGLTSITSVAAWSQTADEIIEKHLQAIGGKDKLKAVQSQRITGKMTMGQGMEAPFTMEMSRPNKMRMEFTIQGMTGVQAYDGKTAWAVMPFMGKTEPEAMPAEETKKMEEQADMDGLLLDYKEHGRTVEYVGKEDLEGTPVHKLKVTQKSGDIAYVYIDAEQYMQLKQTSKSTLRGQEIEADTIFGDFKKVDGLVIPHSIEQRAKGMPGGMVMTISTVEINPSVTDSRFTMPVAAPKAEKIEKKEAPAPPKPPAQ
jgi:outer membrane lipoprotein-sorting protein